MLKFIADEDLKLRASNLNKIMANQILFMSRHLDPQVSGSLIRGFKLLGKQILFYGAALFQGQVPLRLFIDLDVFELKKKFLKKKLLKIDSKHKNRIHFDVCE